MLPKNLVPLVLLGLSVVLLACQARDDVEDDELYTVQAKPPVAASLPERVISSRGDSGLSSPGRIPARPVATLATR